MSRLDRSLISGLSAFQGMTPTDLDYMIGQARSLRVVKDQPIFEQEQEAHSFFLLLDGHVRVVKTTPDGQEVTVRYISPGELMGIAHALGRSTYPASAIAAVDCVALAWPGHLWLKFADSFPSFGANTYKTVGSRLQDAHTRVIEMSTEQVDQRVAHALLKLIKQTGRQTDEGIMIDFPISRQDIAEMTGTTLHTVSRLLSSWEEKGLVKSGREKVTVVEPHRLLLLAEGRTGNN
ncbi:MULTISPECIES: Crp/Fnr family transcriptional regulator [unclassified Mesorhizobium]|uniref:Crp/Fnr family transcriptional regulator n=1 Tax=unclassified Mesorhizobium TaxID=325217 RepID=UPI00112AF6FC|nr:MULTISPECIES: Crp/Fnr family transcriptional regulator [unclassified Mesorhizobium]TPJ40999.1 Crp/Fnr family transcriptional regulator [Mesorhizobium sp. B2-6-6]MCA0008712.1 Crp/Fnr family transcriptional regulator [Mesorhizobium sp. B264B1B]MCA0019410.1 Crp/Fnr family transcriptional regulator [Mesorhizobium sp. B264B1A]MCA0024549.1 Crp/Fnr family transcriptional regulator [Mesorhizobium sp. B263B1A]MCA0055779.1 Crp/Fnr family transcriptional regulator [Mesorhizobium sp. B261B1A]